MPNKPLNKSLADLPQMPETWYLVSRQMHIWVEDDNGEAVRPYLLLLTYPAAQNILGVEMVLRMPDADQVRQFIIRVMLGPPKEVAQNPHRPQHIQFERADLAQALAPYLTEIDVSHSHVSPPDEVESIIAEIEAQLQGEVAPPPGLLSVEGVTPELVGDVFSAAAAYFRATPWSYLADGQPLTVRFPSLEKEGYVQLMGNAGLEFGLVLYWDWEDMLRIYRNAGNLLEQVPSDGWRSITFGEADLVPPEDLEALEKYGWEVVSEYAYPLVMTYYADTLERPSREELVIYEALLRVIPCFVDRHLKPDEEGDYLPVEAELNVSTHEGPMTVVVRYPAGELPDLMLTPEEWKEVFDDLDDNDYDDDNDFDNEDILPFDRRSMEGTMAGFFDDMAITGQDPNLVKAQRLMYDAWEEPEPSRRIKLAQQALNISPDCADAYVLLAEELAETPRQAYDYFRKGFEAGERALGADYFEENEGYFWGLLETRPYMRAREGLANCLWALGRKDDALDHFRDMLRLNPGDNQGIRYLALGLLLQMGRDQEAEQLLNQYVEGGSAVWLYSRALLAFRKEGASPDADAVLKKALEQNPHVPAYLVGLKRMPDKLPPYMGWGDENEAIHYVIDHYNHWWRTRGAVDWMRSHVEPTKKPPKPSKKRGTRGRRKSRYSD